MALQQENKSPSINILVVEDSALDYELICVRLQKESIAFTATRATSEAEFRHALSSDNFDIILSDYNLPNFDGLSALAIAHELMPHIPFIFVSGALGEDIAIETLKHGAVDYVTKQRLNRLGAAVKRAISEAVEKKLRNEIEEQLQFTRQRLNLALEATSDGLWDWDIVKNSLYWSNRFKAIIGYPPEWEVTFERWKSMLHPDDVQPASQKILDYLDKIIPAYDNIYRIRHVDGSYRWMHSRGKAVWDGSGKAISISGGSMDITERKEASRALEESEQRWRTVTEAMPQLVWIDRGSDGYCEYLSTQWSEYTGYPVAELLGFEWLKSLHPEDKDRTAFAWNEAVAGRAEYNIEYRIRRHDGEYRWFKVRGVPVRDSSGAVSTWYGTCTDIHDLKIAEERSEAANRAKSDFLANMSHEIRTPMNAVIGLSSILMMRKDLNPKQTEIVKTLQLSAQSLLGLINDLLDISKIETNMVDIERVTFNLHDLIQDVVHVNIIKAQEKNISLTYEHTVPFNVLYWGDPTRIRQVIMNLVSNGIKFTEKGGVTISANTTPHEDSKYAYIHIHVIDTGIGIPEKKLLTIFDKFTQADTSTTRKFGGTGLGLAISKNLAEIMGGGVEVKSNPGGGTEFTFHLPLEKSDQAAVASNEVSTHELGQKAPSAKGVLLLVEDYAPNIMVAKNMLDDLGYACETAGNGREALAMLRTGRARYKAVLMDVQMPDMDGLEATRLIRKEEQEKKLPPIPIVAMTAHAMQEDKDKCIKAGMDAYIPKPFKTQTLAEVLDLFT